jgi:crossover junction endodeoxyribonuclease RuvC
MTLALGIDPGTATTGYGLVDTEPDGSLVAVKYGVILTPKESTASARLVMIYDQLHELLDEYKPQLAAVEKLFFARNVTTALAV